MTIATKETKEKISVSLSPATLRFADQCQREMGLSSRSEVVEAAFKALRRVQLIDSYRQAAEDYATDPDMQAFVEIGINDGLEPSTEETW